MKASLIVLTILTTIFFSCNQGSESTHSVQTQNQSTDPDEKYIHTKYVYTDAIGARLVIQNSLPKGGLKYKDPAGKEYVYAIFWTRITNQTSYPLELSIDFPGVYELPSSPGNYFKLVLPSQPMISGNESMFNYGLTYSEPLLDDGNPKLSFLDNNINKLSSLERTINPEESKSFYVVTLFDHGLGGTLRTGLSLKGQNVFYRVNDKEIQCCEINLKNLMLQK